MNLNISGIYQIQSIIKPEKKYIGSAINIRKRWHIHLCNLRKNKHHSKKLQRHSKSEDSKSETESRILGDREVIYERRIIDSTGPYRARKGHRERIPLQGDRVCPLKRREEDNRE